jgi:hypothetical protein
MDIIIIVNKFVFMQWIHENENLNLKHLNIHKNQVGNGKVAD